MIYNKPAKELFGEIEIGNIKTDDKFIIWQKYDKFGRAYFGVSNFWNLDRNIEADTELSWLEWDGNEVQIDFTEPDLLESKYFEAVSILKSWKSQLEKYSDSKFCIIMSYDNGDLIDEEDREFSFTLRFWKEREGSVVIPSINDFSQPVIIDYCN